MCPVRWTAGVQQPEIADDSAIKTWLDALASGACDQAAFLLYMQERFESDPDGNWEVLSQLDQYYRRGRLKAEVFHTVKKALAESALGGRNGRAAREAVAREAVAREGAAREAPMVPEIPVARDVAIPQHTVRTEPRDAHPRREETRSVDAAGELKPGSVLRRRYRIENILGQGEMGTVFQALDEYRLDIPPGGRKLAIKVLHTPVTERADLLTRLREEFQQLQLLSHPNIVRVFEFDRDGPIAFFTMELLNGPLLSRVLQARKLIPLERAQALAVVRDVGAAIVHAHSRGVVHGSINPQNIFIAIPGEVRVLDFGAHRANRRSSTPDHEMTMPFATSGYASCQVLEGEPADARDDVFALACVAYLLLSGEHPFSRKTAIEARKANLSPRRPPHLTNRQWHALRAGLRWKREDRPANAQEWLERFDLRGAAKRLAPITDLLEPPHREEPKSVFGMAAVGGAILLLAGAFWIISKRSTLPQLDNNPPTQDAEVSSPVPSAPSTAATPADSAPIAHSTPKTTPKTTPALHDTPAAAPASRPPAAVPPAATKSTETKSAATPPAVTPPAATKSTETKSAAPPAATPAASKLAPTPSAATPSAASKSAATPSAATPPAASKSAATPSASTPASVSAGPSKIEMVTDTIDVPAAESLALVSVRRKGSLRGETNFTWWTESGTAKPGIDFSPVLPQLASIGDGQSDITLNVLLSKAPRTRSKSFYVVIDRTDGGAALGARTLTLVTLVPSD
jgi:serine/threonine protein kinase